MQTLLSLELNIDVVSALLGWVTTSCFGGVTAPGLSAAPANGRNVGVCACVCADKASRLRKRLFKDLLYKRAR